MICFTYLTLFVSPPTTLCVHKELSSQFKTQITYHKLQITQHKTQITNHKTQKVEISFFLSFTTTTFYSVI